MKAVLEEFLLSRRERRKTAETHTWRDEACSVSTTLSADQHEPNPTQPTLSYVEVAPPGECSLCLSNSHC